jgi:hypothetical protein
MSSFPSFNIEAARAAHDLSYSFAALSLTRSDSERMETEQMTPETQALLRSDPGVGRRELNRILVGAGFSLDLVKMVREYLVLDNSANPRFCMEDISKFNAYLSASMPSLSVSSPVSFRGSAALTLTPEAHQTFLFEGYTITVLDITSGYPEKYFATPAQIHKIALCCPQLKELRVSVTKPLCKELVHCRAVEKLVLSCPGDILLTDALSPLIELPSLNTLTIRFPLDKEGAESLARIRNLQTLIFDGCASINEPTLSALSKTANLKVLHFIGMDEITDETLLSLRGCKKLRELHLTECPSVTTSGGADLIKLCPQLEISITGFSAANTPDVTPKAVRE